MKKLLYPLISGLLMLPVAGYAEGRQGEESKQMLIGYTAGNMSLNLGMAVPIIMKGAMQYPAEYMQRLAGARITRINVGVGNNLTEQDNYVFITDKLDGEPLYTQKVERFEYGWNEVVLDTPFAIDGRELFIGFHYVTSGEVLSLDGEADNNMANWVNLQQTSQTAPSEWSHQSGGALNIQAVVEGDNLPQNDVKIDRHTIKGYASVSEGTPMNIVVRNNGAATVRSLEVALTVDDEQLPPRLIEGLSIESNALATVNIGDLEMDGNNIFDVEVEVTAVNGEADEQPSDNRTSVKNVISRKDYTNRKVLMEHFSTMLCANCPGTHIMIEDALRYRQDVVHVVYHSGFGTDPLTTSDTEAYLWLFSDGYSTGSYYAPAVSLDRVNMSAYGATDGYQSTSGPAFLPRRDDLGKIIDTRLSTAALVSVDIDRTYNADTRTLQVAVSGSVPNGSPDRLNASDLRLTVMVKEDGIEGPQQGVTVPMTGLYVHDDVLRKVLTPTWGDKVTFEGADYKSKTYTLTVPAEWDDTKLSVVAFISDYNSNSTAGCQVFNADEKRVEPTSALECIVNPAEEEAVVTVAGGYLSVESGADYITLVNMAGSVVKRVESDRIFVGDVPAGVYLVVIGTESGQKVAKFINHSL